MLFGHMLTILFTPFLPPACHYAAIVCSRRFCAAAYAVLSLCQLPPDTQPRRFICRFQPLIAVAGHITLRLLPDTD